jgi:hypothetical protein
VLVRWSGELLRDQLHLGFKGGGVEEVSQQLSTATRQWWWTAARGGALPSVGFEG